MATCRARQFNDQMVCRCGLAWDMNDPDPPECRIDRPVLTRQERGTAALKSIRDSINHKPG